MRKIKLNAFLFFVSLVIFMAVLLALSGCAPTTTTTSDSQTSKLISPVLSTLTVRSNPSPTTLNISQFLQTVADIPLPGNSTRFDYQSLDPKKNLLFIAHLGDSSLLVFDIKAQKVITEIKGLNNIHGVLVIPELNRVFATATSDHQVVVIDESTFNIIARLPAGNYPDGLAYVPNEHKIFVSDEGGNTEPIIDIQTNKALASIPLGGEAGNSQYDPTSQHIFVDVQSQNQLIEIDPKTSQILTRYPLANCDNDHSLLIDAPRHLAFVTCDGNAKLLILDMNSNMKELSVQDVGEGPDVLALDSEKQLLYVTCESSTISVFSSVSPTFTKIAEGKIGGDAHTIAVDSTTHQVYLALQDVDGKPILKILKPK